MNLSTVRLHPAHAEDDIQGPQGLEAGVTPDQTSIVEPQTCMPAATTRPPSERLASGLSYGPVPNFCL